MDTSKFEQALYNDAKTAFQKIIEQHGDDLYVIGLYHFGGWDGVMPMFNTQSDLVHLQEQAYGSDEKEQKISAKWNPAGFPSLEEYTEYFSNSETEIQALEGPWDESTEDSQKRWQETLAAMEAVMIRLDKDGVFSKGVARDSITLYIATYDEEYADGYERIKRINPGHIVQKVQDEFKYIINKQAEWQKQALEEVLERINSKKKK